MIVWLLMAGYAVVIAALLRVLRRQSYEMFRARQRLVRGRRR